MPAFVKRLLLAAALLLPLSSAHSDGIGNQGILGQHLFGGIGGSLAVITQPTGDILMVDGVSLILQTDGVSFICRAGGC